MRVMAYDYLNHTNLTTEIWFGVDRTAPNASNLNIMGMLTPAALTDTVNFSENVVAQYGMITFNVTAIDGYRGVLSVNMSFDNASGNAGGTPFNGTATNYSGNWNVSFFNISANLTDGLHTVRVMANDGLNNSNRNSTITFRVDKEVPNASFVNTVTTGANFTEATGRVLFNASVIDGSIGVLEVNMSFDNASGVGGTAFNRTAANFSGYWNVTLENISANLTDGLHTIRIMANDRFNHSNRTSTFTFRVDREVPNASNLNIMGMLTPAALTDTVNFSENVVAQYGMITFNVTVIDGVTDISTVNMSFDNASGNAGGTPFNGTATNYSGNWNVSFFNISANFTDGLHTVRVMANDWVNHSNRTTTITFRVDKEVPNASNLNIMGMLTPVALTDTVNFSENVVAQYGAIAFNVTVIDGSIGVLDVNMSFDNASGNAGGTAFNRTAVNFSGNWNVSFPNISSNFSDGLHTVRVMAKDRFNHSNRTTTITFRVDREPPNVSLTLRGITNSSYSSSTDFLAFANNSNFTTGARVLFNASVIDGSIGVLEVNISFSNLTGDGGTAFNRTAANLSGNWNITFENIASNFTDGLHRLVVMANDRFNHSNRTTEFWFTVDTLVPNVTVLTTNGTKYSRNNVSGFNVSASDVEYITSVIFQVSNDTNPFNLTATNVSGNWNTNINASTLPEGAHNITVFANDSAGNSNRIKIGTFVIDRSPPTISLSKAASSTATSLVITITTSEDASTCSANRGSVSGSGSSQTLTATGLSPDTNYGFDVTCQDDQSNSYTFSNTFKTDGGAGGSSGGSGGGGGGGGSSEIRRATV